MQSLQKPTDFATRLFVFTSSIVNSFKFNLENFAITRATSQMFLLVC